MTNDRNRDFRDLTLGELLDSVEEFNAATGSLIHRDDNGKVIHAFIVITGEEADELHLAWEQAVSEVQDRWMVVAEELKEMADSKLEESE